MGISKQDSRYYVVEVHINGKQPQGSLTKNTMGNYEIIRKSVLELGEHKTIFLEEYPETHHLLTPIQRAQIEQYLGKTINWKEEPVDNCPD